MRNKIKNCFTGKLNILKKQRFYIGTQLFFVFLLFTVFLIAMSILANTLFLPVYYRQSRINTLRSVFEKIRLATEEDFFQEEFSENLNDISLKNGVTIVVIGTDSDIIYSSTMEERDMEFKLLGYIFGQEREASDVRILEEDDQYVFREIEMGKRGSLEMYGRLDSGASFLIRTPLDSIDENARYANRFFLIIGLADILVGCLVISIVVRRIAKPVKSLNELSQRMVELDFDARYEGNDRNELGTLGHNMNKMSESLQKTFSELKNANLELQRDIELRQSQDEMRQEFLSNVSHELKTPIALIQGYAEGLQLGISDDPESRDYYCGVIVDEAKRMNSLVQKILTLNQIEFGENAVSLERFSISDLVEGYLSSARLLAEQNDIELRFETRDDLFVWADADRAIEVLNNYFTNAVRYCLPDKEGKKYIEISLKKKEETVRICVFNSGEPIPEESLTQLWDKFYKVDKARSRELGGSGVGLSIVKAIQDSLHQGYGVENYENGVLFWFELEQH